MDKYYYLIFFYLYSLCAYSNGDSLRTTVLKHAESYIGLKEATGNNDGNVCIFHESLGYKCGLAWCAIFVKHNLTTFGIPTKMDARAVSIKNDPPATTEFRGGAYWYPTSQGTGHTGLVYSWEKKNSDKFIGLDGNYSNMVRFVQRSKSKHAKYISDPYTGIQNYSTKKKSDYYGTTNRDYESIDEDLALAIDSGKITPSRSLDLAYRFKVIVLLCCIILILNTIHAQYQKRHKPVI